jgi:hypothetical protein
MTDYEQYGGAPVVRIGVAREPGNKLVSRDSESIEDCSVRG